ncbi:helix-turn-helix transcriptional regulator [Streptomyces sp900105245]|uniref:helix-turn-helix domain-containing protein n=1 Tax=Streptomyces sp. 900105245 TaxID=3154379 RepID=UPI003325FDC0
MPRVFDGAALRDQRKLAGVPASQLARAVARGEIAIGAYEAGRVIQPVDVAAGLADALHLRLDQLLTDAANPFFSCDAPR